MAQLSEFLTPRQLEQLTEALEWVVYAGKGSVTIEVTNGHVYLLGKTISEKLEYEKELEAKVVA